MAELIIQNPSITPNVFEFDEAGRVSAISGYPLAGEGGGEVVKSDLMWKPTVGSDGYVRWTLASSATIPDAAYISGAQGPAGPQGVSGNPGKNPLFQINPENAHWEWKYSGDAEWTDLGVIASGAVGPQGQSGASGASGISPTVTTAAIPGEDGTRVTFTYGPGGDSTYIDVMNGADGASGESGESGYSPTITTATTADAQHPQSGVNVTVTDIDGNKSFNIWNGIDGQGATVNLLEGDGIQITHNGTDYTIGVSADYALKSDLPDVSDMATQTWVGQQNYLTSVPSEYITESELSTTLADYMQSVLTGTGLSGDGKTTALGIDTTASINLTNGSAKSAVSAASAASAYNAQMFNYFGNEVAISTYAELAELAIDSLHADEPGYREEELDEPPLLAEYAASAYLGPNTYLGFDKFVTSGSNISGDKQYVLTSGGWQEAQGGLTSVSANNPISGNGTTNSPLGLDMTDAYTIDGINGITAVPDATSNKVIVKMTDDAWGHYQHLAASASEWDKISGLSAKSNVNITSAGVTTVTNTSGTTENKFTQYAEVASHPTPRMFLCATADSVADITSVLTAASGMGAVIFVIESHS